MNDSSRGAIFGVYGPFTRFGGRLHHNVYKRTTDPALRLLSPSLFRRST
jgi:hypothetical protein